MKHRSSQIVFAHWNERRAGRALPERAEIDPGAIREGLSDTFILAFNQLSEHPFRLAGTRVCALFGGELKGRPFLPLWEREAGRTMSDVMHSMADESIGLVAGVAASTARGDTIELELLLLPLRHWGRSHLRLIGALSPLSAPYWLGVNPVRALALGEHRFLGAGLDGPPPLLRPDAVPRQRHGLTVYDGGQA